MQQQNIITLLGSWSLGSGPLYQQLAQAMRKAILQGDVSSGTRLPSERAFAQELLISRSTVVAAYALLQQEGLIESRHGSGTWVCALPGTRTDAHRSTTNGTLARSPLFETVLSEPREMIDFSTGAPGIGEDLSVEAFTLSSEQLKAVLQTRGYAPLGLPQLRQALAQRFAQSGLPTTSSQILITSGAQQALSLVATLYVQRGDTVVLENPTYFGALDAFRALGARLLPVPLDTGGLRVDVLRRTVETAFPRLVYLMPTFHNPTGILLSEGRRREVARLASSYRVPVIEDNAFADLVLTPHTSPSVASYASKEATVITIGSMNKLFWSGLRVGWLRAPESVITRLGRLKIIADLGTSLLAQATALSLLSQTDRVKAVRQHELKRRLDVLTSLLHQHLPSWTWKMPDGGYFLWVRLPSGNAREFAQVALRAHLVITPGTAMSVDESHSNYLRLPFLLEADLLQTGVERLAQAWDVYVSSAHQQQLDVIV